LAVLANETSKEKAATKPSS